MRARSEKLSKTICHQDVKSTARNLNAFAITDTELKLIAKAAIIGDSKIPKNGYSFAFPEPLRSIPMMKLLNLSGKMYAGLVE